MEDLWNELELDHPEEPGQRERRRRVAAATGLAALAFVGIGMSGALFADSDSLGGNTLTSGTVQIGTNPGSAAFTANNMAPGDEVFGNVTVENNGSLRLRYAMSAQASNVDALGLRSQLRISVFSGVGQVACAAGNVGAGTLEGGPATLGTPQQLFGDPAPGAHTGDRVVNASATEDLCVRVALPLTTDSTYAGANTEITLTFDAEQTANNP